MQSVMVCQFSRNRLCLVTCICHTLKGKCLDFLKETEQTKEPEAHPPGLQVLHVVN